MSIVFIFGVCKYVQERRDTHFWKEFEVFHKLVKELVEPPSKDAKLCVDRMAAIIFELKNFKRYSPYSLRMLKGLREVCRDFPRLIEEIDLTIKYLEKKLSNH